MSLSSRIQVDLETKNPAQRKEIAERAAVCLSRRKSEVERLAAEALARRLADDAVLMVREALAQAVRHNPFLPKDVAKRIAHDVESVAAPFLEATEVFSEDELQALALTVREYARAAMARRRRVSAPLADTLADLGGVDTARSLASNAGAELGAATLRALFHRFPEEDTLLEALAGRSELPLDVVESLLSRVSEAAREKLVDTYGLPDHTEPLVPDSFLRAMLRTIARTPAQEVARYARELHERGELAPVLVLRALQRGHLQFFEAAMAARANIPLENARRLTRAGGPTATAKLSQKAGIPAYLREDYRLAVELAVESLKETSDGR